MRLETAYAKGWLPGCTHGPKAWPWWRLFSVAIVRLSTQPPSIGYALWVYRPGREGKNKGWYFDVYIDRRAHSRSKS